MSLKKRKQTRTTITIALVTMTAGAAVFSLVPQVPDPLRPLHLVLHPLTYSLLTFVYLVATVWDPWTGPRRWPHGARIVVTSVILGGVALEFAQMITPRGATLSDVVGNAIGATSGAIAWKLLRSRHAGS